MKASVRRLARKALAATTILVQLTLLAGISIGVQFAAIRPALASTVCGTPGRDGSPGTLSGTYNTYYAPSAGTTIAAGSTSFSLGSQDTAGGGATTAVTVGDELLIIQMQDGSFDSSNSSAYGDGASGSGYTGQGNAGLYEYVVVTGIAGSTVTIAGAGSGGGLINTYHESAATGTAGQQTFQILRVPQFLTATLGGNFRAAYWDGQTGGVAALDLASTLNLGGATIYATGNGFRGGARTVQTSSPAGWSSGDYAETSTAQTPPADGSKGEGILGSPNYTFYYNTYTTPSTPTGPTIASSGSDGYPGGDQARGAPGDAGGGGTDDDPNANDQNTGGGGGANGGSGGNGGFPWTPTYSGNTPSYVQYPYVNGATKTYAAGNFHDIGGRGGTAIPTVDVAHAFLGGGGGGGANNNGSNNNIYNNYGSSGGTGGGVVMMRIAQTSGSAATIYADGTTGLAPANDGGGGGGAGGTVIITSPTAFSGITVHADGAAGTTANAAPNSYAQQHGPGGGGGGGIVVTSSPVTATVAGGAAGTTTTYATTYGATNGQSGVVSTVSATQIPGVASGAECYSATGTNALYTGPDSSADTTYGGANLTGSFDGSVPVTNNNDFTAAGIPTGATPLVNTSTTPGSPAGNTLSLGSAVTIQVPHALYYDNTTSNANHIITLTAQAPTAPSGWTVEICADSYTGGTGPPLPSPTTPNCATNNVGVTCKPSNFGGPPNNWIVAGTAGTIGNTYTATYCAEKNSGKFYDWYWTIYTAPANGLVAFQRYDASIAATDNVASPNNSYNATHDELYPGFVPLTKSFKVISNGCPAGATPTYPALGVCPGGVLQYTLDYRNVVAGGGLGTEASLPSAFLETGAGSFVVTDDGTQSTTSQTTVPNWATFSNGLKEALSNNLGAANVNCGTTAATCGDSTAGTTFTYDAGHPSGIAATKFTATIGGATFSLYPINYAGQKSQGTVTFAIVVK